MPYRKPNTGMWTLLKEKILKVRDDQIDMEKSFYCGDAAGRRHHPFNDHSSDDLYFGRNIKLAFFTPEMCFQRGRINFKPINGTILTEKYKN